jgi:hypothetical protein
MMEVLYIFAAVFLFLFLVFYYARSSQKTPGSLRELKVELGYQLYGFMGLFEDFAMKFWNRVGKEFSPFQNV